MDKFNLEAEVQRQALRKLHEPSDETQCWAALTFGPVWRRAIKVWERTYGSVPTPDDLIRCTGEHFHKDPRQMVQKHRSCRERNFESDKY